MSIPTLSADIESMNISKEVEHATYPAPAKQTSGLVNGVHTEVSSLYFADKILIIISQGGRLSQWIQVPLSSTSPTSIDTALPSTGADMLPLGHLTPKTLLGAGGEQRETVGHLYASQIASTIVTKSPEETRTVVVGFGLAVVDIEREAFFDLLELVQKVL